MNLKTAVRIVWASSLMVSLVVLFFALPGYFDHSDFFAKNLSSEESLKLLQISARWASSIFSIFSALLSLALAVLVFWRKPEDRMAVFFSFYLIFYAIFMAGPIENLNAYWLPEQPLLALKLQSVLFNLPNMIFLLVFPNGRFQPRWTKRLVWLGILTTIGALFVDSDELLIPKTFSGWLVLGTLFGLLLLSLAVQIFRYVSVYTYTERQQVKWAFFGILSWIVAIGISSIPYYYVLNLPQGTPMPWWQPLGSAFWFLSLSFLPVSFTIAILHSQLWDIDIIIRRTLLYAMLSTFLAMVYFGGVTLLQAIFAAISGQSSTIAIVLSTLAIAALFNPLRIRLQDFIDHRFYRQRVDADRALANFAAIARNETDLGKLSDHLTHTVEETLKPEKVRLWLCQTETPALRREN